MKKTLLTSETLNRFEKLVDVNTLTEEQIRETEHCAYCANMCARNKEAAWDWFCQLIKRYLDINLTLQAV